ncbi:MAG: protein translocase subunit SecF [Spirochaetes bacterium]|nr:protein translocase subunit SecF [Spirochaetota bacterium]
MKKIIPFLKYRFIAIGITNSLIIAFFIITFINGGFRMGIDFVGGVKIVARFEQGVDEAKIRDAIKAFDPMVQKVGQKERNEYIITTKLLDTRTTDASKKEAEDMKVQLSKVFKQVEFMSIENVGPAIGDYLSKSAIKLIIIAMILMTIYLAFRFEAKFSAGAMIALMHDIMITVGFCGILGLEINIPIVAAFLTIFGYSVNDTIIVFDRIRENLHMKTNESMIDIINRSITETLSRTILTVLTTLFGVFAIFLIAGSGLSDFALVLLLGFTIGAYSSIYIASPIVVWWDRIFSKK